MAAPSNRAAAPDDESQMRIPSAPLATDQKEIFLLDFPHCFNCRTGSCSKHGAAAGTASAQSSITDADAEKARQALKLMARFPAELQLQIISNFDVCRFFYMLYTDELQPVRAVHGTALCRLLKEKFEDVTKVFDKDFGRSKFRTSKDEPDMQVYYLFLEIIQKSTDAVVAHLTTELALPPDFARRLRGTVLRLWRVFGTTGSAHDGIVTLKQEATDYFQSLPMSERKAMMRCLRDLGEQYEKVFPLPHIRYETGPKAKLFEEFLETERFAFVLHYFITEYVRVGMTKVFAQVSQGKALDTDDAFGRPGIAPWTAPTDRPASIPLEDGFLAFDAWTYSVRFSEMAITLELPEHHSYDFYLFLLDACREDEAIEWNEDMSAMDGYRDVELGWRRGQDDDTDDDDTDDDYSDDDGSSFYILTSNSSTYVLLGTFIDYYKE